MACFCAPVFIILGLFLAARAFGLKVGWPIGILLLSIAFWAPVFFALASRPLKVILDPFAGTPWVFVIAGVAAVLVGAGATSAFLYGVRMRNAFWKLTLPKYLLALLFIPPAVAAGEYCAPAPLTSLPPPPSGQCGALGIWLEQNFGWSGFSLLATGNPLPFLLYLAAAYLLACVVVHAVTALLRPRTPPAPASPQPDA